MSQDKFAEAASPTPAKPQTSASPVIIVLVVVILAVMCVPTIVGTVLFGGGVLVYWASESRPAPMEHNSMPLVAPVESEMSRSVAPSASDPAELDSTNP